MRHSEKRHSEKQHWVVAVLGTSPAVLTEFVWWLCSRNEAIVPRKILVWTTRDFRLPDREPPVPHGYNELIEQQKWEHVGGWLKDRYGAELPADIEFRMFTNNEGQPVSDIRNEDDNRWVMQQLIDDIAEIKEENPLVTLHALISGGRKTMSAMLQTAVQLLGSGDDGAYHVLVHPDIETPPGNSLIRNFYYPTPDIEKGAIKTWYNQGVEKSAAIDPIPLDKQVSVSRHPLPLLRPLFGAKVDATILQHLTDRVSVAIEAAAPVQLAGGEMLVGDSREIQDLRRMIALTASTSAPVLLQGPPGTGKEITALLIHKNSRRAAASYQTLNCSGITSTLAESELFGHVRGTYTGAISDRKGKIMEANGGTLFLDEIGELDIALQAKLLRFLENHEIQKVGADRSSKVDVRVIAATNRDLRRSVADGTFRQDLFDRLNVLPVTMPPLDSHREDIPVLATHLVDLCRDREHRIASPPFTAEALELLKRGYYPGNVRTLRNIVVRSLAFSTFSEASRIDADTVTKAFLMDGADHLQHRHGGAMDVHDLQQAYAQGLIAILQRNARAYVGPGGKVNLSAVVRCIEGDETLASDQARDTLRKWVTVSPVVVEAFKNLPHDNLARQLFDRATA